MKIKVILVLLVLMLAGCSNKQPVLEKNYNLTVNAGFNTIIELTAYTESKEIFDTYFNEMNNDFTYLNQLFDIYNNYEGINNLKTINDHAGIEAVKVDPIIIDMLLMSKQFYELSNKEFDISFGAVLNIWHNYRETALNELNGVGPVPTIQELEDMLPYTGFDKVVIDKENNTVFLTEANVRLDVGGIAKGYAAEYIAKKFEKDNLIGIVNAGGNVRTLGNKPDGKPWGIGIKNPNGGQLCVISSDEAISSVTSGDYERYFMDDKGNKYHHIIDPKTLFPANYFRSVTILTKDSGMADAMSTALYTLPVEEGLALVAKFEKEFNTKLDALWIVDKGHEINTKNKVDLGVFTIVYTDGLIDKISY